MPTERAVLVEKELFLRGYFYKSIGPSHREKVGKLIDQFASIPALEAVAEAAREVLKECCYPDTGKFQAARANLLAAIDRLEKKP